MASGPLQQCASGQLVCASPKLPTEKRTNELAGKLLLDRAAFPRRLHLFFHLTLCAIARDLCVVNDRATLNQSFYLSRARYSRTRSLPIFNHTGQLVPCYGALRFQNSSYTRYFFN
jgi:hypothetical protein